MIRANNEGGKLALYPENKVSYSCGKGPLRRKGRGHPVLSQQGAPSWALLVGEVEGITGEFGGSMLLFSLPELVMRANIPEKNIPSAKIAKVWLWILN